jgi:hypothetical protein
MDWPEIKELTAQLGVAKDALHIYFGILIQILAAAGLRRRLGTWMPWAAVLLAVIGNEALDLRYSQERQIQDWQVLEAGRDVLNTILVPTLLLILCRYAPNLFARRAAKVAKGSAN